MKKLISRTVSLLIVAAIALAGYEAYFKKPAPNSPNEAITFGAETDTAEIAKALKESGVISSAALFKTISGLSGSFKDFHAGTFIFKEGMSVVDALKTLSYNGPKEIGVTIPEGWGLREIGERLVAMGVVKTKEELIAVTGEPGKTAKLSENIVREYAFLSSKPADANLEGYLFPDTYRFYPNSSAADVVGKLLGTFGEKTKEHWTPDQLHGRSVHEVLTMASILEAEVKDEVDRAKIADILFRRLEVGMPLQVDSSVNYITGKNTPSISGNDKSIDSKWNTYKYKGLPPGPIGNPGLASIRATLSPTPNRFWYFLTAPDGTVIYSKTLDEHNAAKTKYLK